MDRDASAVGDIASRLQRWRTGVLNIVLIVASVAGLFVFASLIPQVQRDPRQWPALLVGAAIYLFLLAMTLLRRIDLRLRAAAFLLVDYAVAIVAFVRGGLAGDGRVYLLLLPVLAVIITGARAGMVTALVGMLLYVAFALLAHVGLLENWLIIHDNPLTLDFWWDSATDVALALAVEVVLLWQFTRFQERTMQAEHRNAVELAQSSDLLRQRAEELEKTNRLLAERTRALATATEVSRQIASLTDEAELRERFVTLIYERFYFYNVDIFLLDLKGDSLALRAAASPGGRRMLQRGFEIELAGSGPLEQAFHSRQPQVEPTPARFLGDLPQSRWIVALPLRVGNEALGVLDIHFQEESRPADDLVQILGALADQLAVGLENARLFTQTRYSLEELEKAHRLVTGQAWDEFVRARPALRRYQAGEGQLGGEVWQQLAAQALQAETPLVAQSDEEKAVLTVPVRLHGVPIGVIGVQRERPWRPDEARLAQRLAERVAFSLENVRLLEEAQRRAARLALVNRITAAIGATLKLDDLLYEVYRQLAPVFEPDAFFAALYDAETNELDFRLPVDGGKVQPRRRQPLAMGLSSVVITTRKPLLVRDWEKEKGSLPAPVIFGRAMPSSWLGVPMLIGDRVIGVVSVQQYRANAYSEEDQLLLSTVADQLAVAVEKARLFEETQRLAERERLVSEVVARARESLDMDAMLRTAVRATGEMLGGVEVEVRLRGD